MANLQQKTGFNNQSFYAGNCAQRSLVHSLLLLGIPMSEEDAHEKTSVPFLKAMVRGTSEQNLKKGIRRCRCIPFEHTIEDWREASDKIREYLESGMPVIVSVSRYSHWMVLAGIAGKDAFYWVDSSEADLYGYDAASELRRWMDGPSGYYFIGVKPEEDHQLARSIVPEFERVYDYFDDDVLAEYWGVYLEDLSDAFDSPTKSIEAVSAEDFFDRYEKILIDAVVNYHGTVDRSDVAYEVGNYRAVAESHKMSVSQAKLPGAIIKVTAAVALLF